MSTFRSKQLWRENLPEIPEIYPRYPKLLGGFSYLYQIDFGQRIEIVWIIVDQFLFIGNYSILLQWDVRNCTETFETHPDYMFKASEANLNIFVYIIVAAIRKDCKFDIPKRVSCLNQTLLYKPSFLEDTCSFSGYCIWCIFYTHIWWLCRYMFIALTFC